MGPSLELIALGTISSGVPLRDVEVDQIRFLLYGKVTSVAVEVNQRQFLQKKPLEATLVASI